MSAEAGRSGPAGPPPASEPRPDPEPPPAPGPPTAFLLHPDSSLHDTGWSHPEHQGRLRALASTVGKDLLALHERVVQIEPGEATEEELLRVHTPEHVERIREAVERAAEAGRSLDLTPDTRVSADSWDAALGSVGALLTACRGVAEGTWRNAFVACRPPGHHATPSHAMGFCLFNSVAVAARALQAEGLAERVAIVDWDVHHGNGTQDTFWRDGSVFYLSLHQHPHYPGTGMADERGEGAGEGSTLNVPLAAATPRAEYLERFDEALEEVRAFRPDFVLVSSGFDVLRGDPLGGQTLEPADMHRLARRVMELLAPEDGRRIVAALEGGYDPARTAQGAVAVIRALAGVEAPGP